MRLVLGLVGLLMIGLPSAAMADDQCEELRIGCQMKRQLGEVGQRNCRQHRECMAQACPDLRQACMHKGKLGEKGQGNCKTYRDTCRTPSAR